MYKPTALFIGRFQPFHNGHLLVVEGMTKVCGKIIIGIGSSQESKTEKNPFSALERREMIQRALQGKNLIPMYDISFVDLPDETDDVVWRDKVLEKAGVFDKVWSGNDWTIKCFEGVKEIQNIHEVPRISATEVRARMKSNGDWRSLVPKEVAVYISEIDGVKRLE